MTNQRKRKNGKNTLQQIKMQSMVCVHEKYMMILMIPCLFDDEMIIKLLNAIQEKYHFSFRLHRWYPALSFEKNKIHLFVCAIILHDANVKKKYFSKHEHLSFS